MSKPSSSTEGMTLRLLPQALAVCKLRSPEGLDWSRPFLFVCKTEEELSVVCEAALVPQDAEACETGWRMLKIEGELDFGLVGIIARIAALLAAAGISVFVVSTYNTDYVLVKEAAMDEAVTCLREGGYHVTG